MSISTELTRAAQNAASVNAAKAAIASAITAKGGTVGQSDGLENFPAAIAGIPSENENRFEVKKLSEGSGKDEYRIRGTTFDSKDYCPPYGSYLGFGSNKTYLYIDNTIESISNFALNHAGSNIFLVDENGGTNFEGLKFISTPAFYGCKTEGDYYFPEFTQSNGWGQSYFNACKATRAFFPKLRNLGTNLSKLAFSSNLVEAQVGSVGYGINNVGTGTIFASASSPDFEETLYTDGSRVDALLTLARTSNATATIIIKASEDTTYGGESYLAGETILTDSPEVAQ